MKAETIKGLAVVSITDGAKLGRVDDLIFDPATKSVSALRVSAEKQNALIPFEKIKSLGSGAITVPDTEVTQWVKPDSAFKGLMNLEEFKKLRVVDEAGTFLGTIQDVEIDPQDGRVTEVATHKGGVLGLGGESHQIPVRQITSIGAEVMVVATMGAAPERDA